MKKVLIITYYWPPGSGAGVQRWLKFVKYLPQYGWEPVVLTVDPGYAAYPVTDQTLENDILPGTRIIRTRAIDYFTIFGKNKKRVPSAGFASGDKDSISGRFLRFMRGNFFIPDPRRGWNGYAYRKACEIINNEEVNHVITTSPPHSTQLIGLKLKKRFPGLKWIADLRDPWTDIYYYKQFYHLPFSFRLDRHYERSVLCQADRLITVGPSLARLFEEKNKGTIQKLSVITNGYDPADFETSVARLPERFTITYTGTISDAYPIDGFLDSLVSLQLKKRDFILRFIGLSPESVRRKVRSKLKQGSVEFHDYASHKQSIDYLLNSSILLLIIPDHVSAKSILTGKLFEYIASSRRILCLGPVDGDAAEVIRSNGYGETFAYNDIAGIENYISDSIDKPGIVLRGHEMYSHKSLTEKLVSVIK